MDTFGSLAVIAGAFLLAGFVKGVIGVGLPTVSVGLLGLLMSPVQAAAILVVPALITNIWQAAAGGGVLALVRRLWPLLVGICVGTFAGVLVLPRDANGSATMWLGVALALYAALGLFKGQFSVPRRTEMPLGLLMGSATGAVAVATGVFVMPGTPYVQSLDLTRDKMVQALGISLTVSALTLGLALAHTGNISPALLKPTLIALAAALAGMVLGQLVRGRIKAATFRVCFFLGLLALGLHLTLRGLI